MAAVANVTANSVLTSPKVNEIIGAVNGLGGQFVRKTIDEAFPSNITLQPDDELILPMEAASIYAFDMLFLYVASTVADIKLKWTLPAGTTAVWTMVGALGGVLTTYTGDATLTCLWDGSGSLQSAHAWGAFITSATPGNASLTWAQVVSEATATTVKANSYINARKVA